MKMKIELFKSGLGDLERLPYDSATFESMAEARATAFAEGSRRGADQIVIASVASPLVRERWVPDGTRWKRFEPPQPYGIVGDPPRPKPPPPEWHEACRHQVALFARRAPNRAIRDYLKALSVEPHRRITFYGKNRVNIYGFASAAEADAFMQRFGGMHFDPKQSPEELLKAPRAKKLASIRETDDP